MDCHEQIQKDEDMNIELTQIKIISRYYKTFNLLISQKSTDILVKHRHTETVEFLVIEWILFMRLTQLRYGRLYNIMN